MLAHLLKDEATLMKYTEEFHPITSKPPMILSGATIREAHHEELLALVLYRILRLIFYLDKAKMTKNVLHQNLFKNQTGVCKSTQAVFEAMCKVLFFASGNLIKQLERRQLMVMGVAENSQCLIDEVEYKVEDLEKDFQNAVLLAQVYEIHTESVPLSLLKEMCIALAASSLAQKA